MEDEQESLANGQWQGWRNGEIIEQVFKYLAEYVAVLLVMPETSSQIGGLVLEASCCASILGLERFRGMHYIPSTYSVWSTTWADKYPANCSRLLGHGLQS